MVKRLRGVPGMSRTLTVESYAGRRRAGWCSGRS